MNTYFNLQRIKHLLTADWIEHRKSLLITAGGVFLIWILVLLFTTFINIDTDRQIVCFVLGGLFTFIYYCRFVGKKIHRPKGLYYTLPASNEEKFFTLLFEGLLFFIAFNVIFWGGLFILRLTGSDVPILSVTKLYSSISSVVALLFVSSLIFLSYVMFRKYPLLICFACIAILGYLFSIVAGKVIQLLSEQESFESFLVFAHDAFEVLRHAVTPLLSVFTVGILYVAYLKLKRKELR